MGDGNRLYMCGTNAHSPKDWVIYVSFHVIFNRENIKHVYGKDNFEILIKIFFSKIKI